MKTVDSKGAPNPFSGGAGSFFQEKKTWRPRLLFWKGKIQNGGNGILALESYNGDFNFRIIAWHSKKADMGSKSHSRFFWR